MNLDSLNKWLTLVANFGVIAGIIFLAIEVGQNQASLDETNAINRADTAFKATELFNVTRGMLAQDEQLARIWIDGSAGNELSAVDQLRFMSLCETNLWTFQSMYLRYISLGQIAEADGIISDIHENIRPPGMRQCWDRIKETMIKNGNENFVISVEER